MKYRIRPGWDHSVNVPVHAIECKPDGDDHARFGQLYLEGKPLIFQGESMAKMVKTMFEMKDQAPDSFRVFVATVNAIRGADLATREAAAAPEKAELEAGDDPPVCANPKRRKEFCRPCGLCGQGCETCCFACTQQDVPDVDTLYMPEDCGRDVSVAFNPPAAT